MEQVYSLADGIREPDRNTASPLILGAGFDAQAHRFDELLKDVRSSRLITAPPESTKAALATACSGDFATRPENCGRNGKAHSFLLLRVKWKTMSVS